MLRCDSSAAQFIVDLFMRHTGPLVTPRSWKKIIDLFYLLLLFFNIQDCISKKYIYTIATHILTCPKTTPILLSFRRTLISAVIQGLLLTKHSFYAAHVIVHCSGQTDELIYVLSTSFAENLPCSVIEPVSFPNHLWVWVKDCVLSFCGFTTKSL